MHVCTKKFIISITAAIFICFYVDVSAQVSKSSHFLKIILTGKDSVNPQSLGLQTTFSSEVQAIDYIEKIPTILASRGYPVASIDSSWQADNNFYILLYPGQNYNWIKLSTVNLGTEALEASGFNEKNYIDKPLNISQMQLLQQRLLNFYERNGYPFAAIRLDSITIREDKMNALLVMDKGLLYHIDSIRMYGKVQLNKKFLQRYLNIRNGSVYNKEKLEAVDKKMLELPFLATLQPSDLTMLGSGSVLNLYVQPKRSSQINFLIGFLPSANQSGKLQLTGDVNLDLKNLMGNGESILLKWQQLQVKSPRLNLGFSQPYIFNSQFGFSFLFDLFKKDSNFLQLNAQTGLQFDLSTNQSGKLFIQWQNASLLSGAIDTNIIKAQKKLPVNIDVNAVNVGLDYEWLKTNYRFNPRKGNEINIISVIGVKNIKRNTDIINIRDQTFNYSKLYDSIKPKSYQLRIKASAVHYFPLGKLATVKTAVYTGLYSSPSIFRNELFQIGGYRLLRGFDEESIYATKYAVATLEYRYLIGLNSFLFFFSDIGFTKNKYQRININNQFLGSGLGIMFETKAGLLNLSYAVGKRNDLKFNLRESSKLHFGYINYF